MERSVTITLCVAAIVGLNATFNPDLPLHLETMSTLSLGVVVLAIASALIAGEVLRIVRVPRPATYAVVGGLIAPMIDTGLPQVSIDRALHDHAYIFVLAAATVGLSVGLRVSGRAFLTHRNTVLSHSAVTTTLLGGAGMLWFLYGSPVLGIEGVSFWVALFGSAMFVAGSPDVTVAVSGEFHSEGSACDLGVIASSVNAVIAALVCYAALFAMHVEEAGAILPATRWMADVGIVIAATLGIGALAGAALIGVLRLVPNQVIPIAITACVCAASLAPFDPGFVMLGAFTAGIVIANASQFAFTLYEALDRTGPLYLSTFFVFLFVATPLSQSPAVWTAAAVVAGGRVMLILASSAVVSRVFRINPESARPMTVSMVSQGAPSLLFLMFASTIRPEVQTIAEPLLALVLLDLVLGSWVQKRSIVSKDAKELILRVHSHGDLSLSTFDMPRSGPPHGTELTSHLPVARFDPPALRSEALNRLITRLHQRFTRIQAQFESGYVDVQFDTIEGMFEDARTRLREHLHDTFDTLRTTHDHETRAILVREQRNLLSDELRDLIASHGADVQAQLFGDQASTLFDRLERACEMPATIRVPEEPHHRTIQAGDSNIIRARKLAAAMSGQPSSQATRLVPAQLLAHYFVTDAAPDTLSPAFNMIGRHRAFAWRKIFTIFDEIDAMYDETLAYLDSTIAKAPVDPAEATAREVEQLEDFDKRLAQGAGAIGLLEETSSALLESPSRGVDDQVLTFWASRLADVSTGFDEAHAELVRYDLDIRRRLELGFAELYQNLNSGFLDAGTFLLPARRFNPSQRESQGLRERSALTQRQTQWRQVTRAYLDRRVMRLHYRRLETGLRKLLSDTVEVTSRELYSHFTYYPAEISERCADTSHEMGPVFQNASPNDLGDAITQIRESLVNLVQNEALQDVHEMRESNRFAQITRGLAESLARLVEDGPESFHVVDDTFWDSFETEAPHAMEAIEIPYGFHLKAKFVRASIRSYSDLEARVSEVIEQLTAGLSEINRVLSFNLDAALGELADIRKADPDKLAIVAEFAIGGLRQAGERASDLLDDIQGEIDEIDELIVEVTVGHLRSAREMLFDTSPSELKAWVQTLERESHRSEMPQGKLRDAAHARSVALFETLRRPLHEIVSSAQDQIWADEDFATLQNDAGLATFENLRPEAVPTTYQRLFQPSPVEIPDLYVSAERLLGQFALPAGRWREKRKVSIAITGDMGSGKTSFVNRALTEHLGDYAMLRWNLRGNFINRHEACRQLAALFGLRQCADVESVLAALHELQGARVVLVDGLEKLYLRTMSGGSGLEALLQIIAESPKHILWVVTANHALWDHLTTMYTIGDYFSDTIQLEMMSRDAIEEMLMKRHGITGYRVEFVLESTQLEQEKLRQRFFDRLFEACQGNPVLALYYWLESTSAAPEDENLMRLTPSKRLRLGYLRQLEDDKLLALAQFVIHEHLTESQFGAVFRSSEPEARRELAFLESLGVLEKSASVERGFRINPVLYHHVSQAARERNII